MPFLNNDFNARIAYFVGVFIGGVGAIGQAWLMHNTLVHSYPFKMMTLPPSTLYAWIGEIGFYVAPTIAIVALLFCKSARRFLIPIIPVVICPLVYWLAFELTFAFSPYEGAAMQERNFDGYTGETARHHFGFEVGGLILWGTIIGTIAGIGISVISKFFTKRRLT